MTAIAPRRFCVNFVVNRRLLQRKSIPGVNGHLPEMEDTIVIAPQPVAKQLMQRTAQEVRQPVHYRQCVKSAVGSTVELIAKITGI